MKVEKTTFKVDGIQEPCFLVSSDDDFVQVRISTCYHLIGRDNIYVREYIDGEFNSEDEWCNFHGIKGMTKKDALEVAKKYSIYLR